MAISEKDHIEVIKSEMEDDYSDDSLFNISLGVPICLFVNSYLCIMIMSSLSPNSKESMYGTKLKPVVL